MDETSSPRIVAKGQDGELRVYIMKKYFIKLWNFHKTHWFEFNEGDPRFPSVVSPETALEYLRKNYEIDPDAQITLYQDIQCPNCQRVSCLERKGKGIVEEKKILLEDGVEILPRCATGGFQHWLEILPFDRMRSAEKVLTGKTQKEPPWRNLDSLSDVGEILKALQQGRFPFSVVTQLKVAAIISYIERRNV